MFLRCLTIALILGCAATWTQAATKVMFLGDSLTDGFGGFEEFPPPVGNDNGWAGFRSFFQDLVENSSATAGAAGSMADVEIIGDFLDGPTLTPEGHPLIPNHQGYPGIKVGAWFNGNVGGVVEGNGLAITLYDDEVLEAHTPDVIALMIGTNDMNGSPGGAALVDERIDALIDQIYGVLPDVKLAVSNLMPIDNDQAKLDLIDGFNDLLPGIVADHVLLGRDVIAVEMFSGFIDPAATEPYVVADILSDVMFDDLHPNDAGYDLMANRWYGSMVDAGFIPGDPGDADFDGMVNLVDLNRWLADDTGWAGGDFNGDGLKDLIDVNIWLTAPPPSASPILIVPEPTTAAILLIGAGLLLGRRRR